MRLQGTPREIFHRNWVGNPDHEDANQFDTNYAITEDEIIFEDEVMHTKRSIVYKIFSVPRFPLKRECRLACSNMRTSYIRTAEELPNYPDIAQWISSVCPKKTSRSKDIGMGTFGLHTDDEKTGSEEILDSDSRASPRHQYDSWRC